MSLPTSAVIRNIDGDEIGRQYCNCGWFRTYKAIASTILHQIKDDGFVDTDVIDVYGLIVPIKLVRSVKDSDQLSLSLQELYPPKEQNVNSNKVPRTPKD